jgi:BatD DUF11 like domain
MKRLFRISFVTLSVLGLAFAFLAPRAYAQSPSGLRAEVDANDITTDDTVTYTLTLTTPDGNAPKLGLPTLDGFQVVGSHTASQYSSVNGSSSASMIYAFELQPTRTGDLTIPSLNLDLNGQVLATEPLTVHVTPGNGTPTKKSNNNSNPFGGSTFSNIFGNDPFADPFFNDSFTTGSNLEIQAATDKQSVYVGEPVQYSVRVSSSATLLGEPEYDQPKFTGFWAHQPPETQRGVNGSEITTLLFPTKAGQLTIDPATIRADGGFFSDAMEKQTDPVTIDVKPLPQGAPAEFNGAVGQFEISATPDTTKTRVGEPVTLRVQIRGAGNFDTLADPKWQNDSSWRASDAKPQTETRVQAGQLVGTRTYERTLIPTKEGTLSIPALKFAYFDPKDAQYHVVATGPIAVQVAPGDPSLTQNVVDPNAASNANPQTENALNANASTLALKGAPTQLTTAAKPLVEQPLFLGLFLVPLGIVAFDIALGLRKRYLDSHVADRRASRAYQRAVRNLRNVRRAENAPVAIAATVKTYLEDKLNRTLLGVPHSTLAQILPEYGISYGTTMQVIEMLRGGESFEFGTTPRATAQESVDEAIQVLQNVENEWME